MFFKQTAHSFVVSPIIRLVLIIILSPLYKLLPVVKFGELDRVSGIQSALEAFLYKRLSNFHIIGNGDPDLIAVQAVLTDSRVRVIEAEISGIGLYFVQPAFFYKPVNSVAYMLLGIFSDIVMRGNGKGRQKDNSWAQIFVEYLVCFVQLSHTCILL